MTSPVRPGDASDATSGRRREPVRPGYPWTKALLIFILLGEALYGVFLLFLGWLFSDISVAEGVGTSLFLAAVPFALVPILARRPARSKKRLALRRTSFAIVVIAQVALVAWFSLEGFLDLRGVGLSAGAISRTLIAIAAGLIGLAACIRLFPRPEDSAGSPDALGRPPRLSTGLLALGMAMAVFGMAVGITNNEELGCESFQFDKERWRDDEDPIGQVTDREGIAETLTRCNVLEGKSERQVQAMLGRGSRTSRYRLTYYVGWVHDAIGPGDEQLLRVDFERRHLGRVDEATLSDDPGVVD